MAVEKVKLRHPHTGETVEVDGTPAELVPYMVKGFAQVKAEDPPEPEVEEEK